jgi:hypothetical protein
MPRLKIVFLVAFLTATAAAAQGISNLSISGSQATATIDLPGVAADLSLTFEGVVGLTPQNLGLSARLVNPLALLARLPAGGLLSIPVAFPVEVSIHPPPAGGLSFSGIQSLELHVFNLSLIPGSPLRLFTSSGGGAFHDITGAIGSGSYRARGTTGSFSEFLIVADLRPAATVINEKFDAVDSLLAGDGGLMPAALASDLTSKIHAARAMYAGGDLIGASRAVGAFADTVRNSGGAIPDVWRASGDLTNVAGLLRAAASTLQFSLNLASGGS